MMAARLETLAREALGWFHYITRPGETAQIATLKDGHPEWVTDLVREAHEGGDLLPDDWTYLHVWFALEHVADAYGPDAAHDFADSCVDVYNHDRLAWLTNYPRAVDYVNEGREEFGTGRDLIDEIGTGQYLALTALYESVVRSLRERADEGDDDE